MRKDYLIERLEGFCPLDLQEDWDNCGFQVDTGKELDCNGMMVRHHMQIRKRTEPFIPNRRGSAFPDQADHFVSAQHIEDAFTGSPAASQRRTQIIMATGAYGRPLREQALLLRLQCYRSHLLAAGTHGANHISI